MPGEMISRIGGNPWAQAAAFGVNSALTLMSNSGNLGLPQDQVSARYQTPVTPAPFAFGIWGLIYGWEAFMMAEQIRNPTVGSKVGKFFILANVLQAAWNFAFAQEKMIPAATVLSGISYALFQCVQGSKGQSWAKVMAPLSLHFGWSVLATLLNWNIVANKASLPSEVQTVAAYGTVLAAILLGMQQIRDEKNLMTAGALAWGLLGIGLQNENSPAKLISKPRSMIETIAKVGSLVLGGLIARMAFANENDLNKINGGKLKF